MSHTLPRVPLLVLALAAVPIAALDTPSLHNPTLLQTLQGSDAAALLALPDLDGDGLAELAVGRPDAPGGGQVQVLSSADGQPLWTISADGPGLELGAALALVDDRDGDGLPELAVGAPARGLTGLAGQVQLRSSQDGGLLWTVSGQVDGAFGASLATVPDRDGDGNNDLAVGSPLHDVGGAEDAGRVVLLDADDGAPLLELLGEQAHDQLGAQLQVVLEGAFGASHDPDIIIAATAGGDQDQGRIEWRRLSDLGLVRAVAGQPGDTGFGSALALLGDVDGDGDPDLAVGTDGLGSAALSLVSGADGQVLERLDGPAGTGFGSRLAPLGDITGDGRSELAVGASQAGLNGAGSGSLEILDGADLERLHLMAGSPGSGLGAALVQVPDRDGDTLPELAVAGPGGQDLHVLSFSRFASVASGVPGTSGTPQLTAQGTLAAGTPLGTSLSSARHLAAAELVWGEALVIDPATETWVPLSVDVSAPLLTDALGKASLQTIWPGGVPAGTVIYFQYRVVDPQAAGGLARSNVVVGLTQ